LHISERHLTVVALVQHNSLLALVLWLTLRKQCRVQLIEQYCHGHPGAVPAGQLCSACSWILALSTACKDAAPAARWQSALHGTLLQGLSKLIGDHAPAGVKAQKFENFFGRKIAVDASMCMYQFLVRIEYALCVVRMHHAARSACVCPHRAVCKTSRMPPLSSLSQDE
jgi:XPG N-terminal domain